MHLDNSETYYVTENFRRRGALRLRSVDEHIPVEQLALGEVVLAAPVRFTRAEGTKAGDFLGTTWASLHLVSATFVNCLESRGFTGWSTFPVEVQGKLPEDLGQLWGFSVHGRSGPFDDSLSELVIVPPPVPAGEAMPHYRGVYVQPGSWDGNDVFCPAGTTMICVTSQVREAMISDELVGMEFERLSEMLRFAE